MRPRVALRLVLRGRTCARKALVSVADLTGVFAAAASRSTRTMSASLTPPLSAVSASVRACLHGAT